MNAALFSARLLAGFSVALAATASLRSPSSFAPAKIADPGKGQGQTWPPSGWMAWGHFRCELDCVNHPTSCINEDLFTSISDAMVKNGFAAAGYKSIHVDDCWQSAARDPTTYKLVANATRFPGGMRAVADYVHAQGLYFGFYSALNFVSCMGFPASRSAELVDINTFVLDWTSDYLKLDGCGQLEYYEFGYADAGRALNQTGKSVTYSCSWPAYLPPDETKKAAVFEAMIADGCNLWRNYADIQPYWSSLSDIIEHFGTYGQFLKPFANEQHIHDADMLIIGEPGITDDEGRTQMSIWSIIMSPLLISADVRNISQSAKDILLNPEALAVSRDPAYEMGYRVLNDAASGQQVWARNLSDASVAFALYNSNDSASFNISVPFEVLKFSWTPGAGASIRVRDIWSQQDVGVFNSASNFTSSLIAPHGTGFFRAWQQ